MRDMGATATILKAASKPFVGLTDLCLTL